MLTVVELQKAEQEYMKANGGYWEMSAMYNSRINKFSRAKIRAFKREHGEAWLGNVNFYDETPENFTQYKRGKVWNFEYHFVIPVEDQQLRDLIDVRNEAPYTGTQDDLTKIDPIFDRIEELGGVVLNWV